MSRVSKQPATTVGAGSHKRGRRMRSRLKYPPGFWDNVKFQNNHWYWTGMVRKSAGGLQIPVWYAGNRKTLCAAREAWRRLRGEPSGIIVPRCKERRCVNPDHFDLMDMNIDRYIAKELDGCWIWLGRCGHSGIPIWSDSIGGIQRGHSVTNLIWRRDGRPLTKGCRLWRECQNKRCVKPGHCRRVTVSELALLAQTSPRVRPPEHNPSLSGAANGRAMLTRMQVERIKKMVESNSYTYAEIGRRFKVSGDLIRNIAIGKSYVTDEKKTVYKNNP